MFCKQCGKEIGEQDTFCPYCGASQDVADGGAQANSVPPQDNGAQYQQQQYQQYQQQQQYAYQQQQNVQDSGSAGWGVLGFFIPLVGLILFLVWKDTKPRSAKSAGIGALVGVIVSFVFGIIVGVAGGLAAASQVSFVASAFPLL